MRIHLLFPGLIALTAMSACTDLKEVGRLPEFTPITSSSETTAMENPSLPVQSDVRSPADGASLWTSSRQSLLGDRRAVERGDILTVVIEIDDSAEMSNTSARGRSGSESMGIPSLLGIPQQLNKALPDGATMDSAVSTNSSSSSSGNGSVKRNEKLQLMVAATIVDVLPNGVLHIQGSQEVRVNYEIRELLVEGYVRPEDISRQNEITYDKIASARISYGGRGQITQVQQPRYGQQIADIVLPF
ncbi:flagellar basal body L-ring protein FlgH [Celeribacter neptunius]|uniref:Flagellar L-ring protein n=1 Tax=Celeribacter neptunius TaxID=588602 RepID=A0A1I3SSV4_9RHOB|nr:flagellar basal body L-ring protein FlgH [Celeribacter neptunius]SFJ61473.1 flagellar L-ring protein precursor FlgH [Celeribacter neptunius]